MTQYIIRRVLLMIPTLVGVSLLITGLLRLLPGDAVDILASQSEVQGASAIYKELVDSKLQERGVDPVAASFAARIEVEEEIIGGQLEAEGLSFATANDAQKSAAKNTLALEAYKDDIRRKIGLDKNFFEQWWSWASHAIRLDFGESLLGSRSVNDELKARIPVSIELGLIAMVVSVLIALPAGVISAVKQDTWLDYGTRSFAIAMLALPSFFVATLIIAFSSRWWSYSFPINYTKFWEDPISNLELVLVPGIILGIGISGTLLRLTRAQMLEVLRQDYIRTARAKGLASTGVVVQHGVRNALIPVVTVIGLQIPVLIGGSLVLESIFGIPGIAQYLFAAISNREFPAIIAINMIVATLIVVSNLVVDITYAFLDPRIRLA